MLAGTAVLWQWISIVLLGVLAIAVIYRATHRRTQPNTLHSEPLAPAAGRSGETLHQSIVITDVQIPFGRIVEIILTWSIATIPAMIILGILFGVLTLVVKALTG